MHSQGPRKQIIKRACMNARHSGVETHCIPTKAWMGKYIEEDQKMFPEHKGVLIQTQNPIWVIFNNQPYELLGEERKPPIRHFPLTPFLNFEWPTFEQPPLNDWTAALQRPNCHPQATECSPTRLPIHTLPAVLERPHSADRKSSLLYS